MRAITTISGMGNTRYHGYASLLFVLLIGSLALLGCQDQKTQTIEWTEYQPVYMTHQEFENAVEMETPRELNNPGKFYFYDSYLFVNEVNKGVHIIDNSDPASPQKVGFVNIPANKDIAVKDGLLYADSNSDLLVFDIENMQNADLVTRLEGVFNFSADQPPAYPHQPVDASQGVVVDWKQVTREETCRGDCNSVYAQNTVGGRGTWGGVFFDAVSANAGAAESTGGGVGGSMARFAITGEYLYAVDDVNLLTFDISSSEPTKVNRKEVGWSIETIFPNKENLYIGSASAMYIFDISDPAAPNQMSMYTHFTACDPVVVEGNHAFVTLRATERCPRGVNRLEVIDVEDPYDPQKVAFYEMMNPHGLGIDNGNLFVSEGKKGLKIMDASDPANIELLRHIKNISTYDVIPYNDVLMVTGESGILQYDYSDINNMKHLSTIEISESED